MKTKKSKSIKLGFVPVVAFAALLTGCGNSSDEKAVCTDKSGTVVEEARCKEEEDRQVKSGGVMSFYYWYILSHGGNNRRYPPIGSKMSGGRMETITPHTAGMRATSRGGFGRSAGGRGSSGE